MADVTELTPAQAAIMTAIRTLTADGMTDEQIATDLISHGTALLRLHRTAQEVAREFYVLSLGFASQANNSHDGELMH
jgi:hypothetical protein